MNTATTAFATTAFTSTASATAAHCTFPRDAGFSGRDAKNDLMFAATLSVMLAACAIWPIAGAAAVQTSQTARAAASAPAPVAMARLDTVVILRIKPAASAVVAVAEEPSRLETLSAAELARAARHVSAPSGSKTL